MSYQALYRQWRPVRFADFVGQEAIIATLRHQVQSGRIAHAYLFCGSRGTGKTSTAKVLARAINCRAPQDGEPCGRCEACERLAEENNLDVVEIDAASNNGVDEIRDLRDKVKYPPQYGGYRVYIIDEVHMLSTGAFNALLKTLEEPPAHAVFILATTEPQKLPATVLSRCQRYDFRRIPAQQIAGRLREAAEKAGARAEEAALRRIARAAEGGMRDALSILDMCLSYSRDALDEALVLEVLGATDRDFLFRFTQSLLDADAAEALRAVDALMRGGRDPSVFARDVTQHLRALLLAQSCGDTLPDLLEVTEEDAARYREQAERLSRDRLLRLLDGFLAAETDMKWSNQPRVSLEAASVRACQPEDGRTDAPTDARADGCTLEALAERISELERGLASAPRVVAPSDAPAATPDAAPQAAQIPKRAAPLSMSSSTPSPAPTAGVWPKAMEALKRNRPDLFAQLSNGRYAGCEGHAYRVTFPLEAKVYLQVLGLEACRAPVEQALRDAGDAEATLLLEEESTAPTKEEVAAADQVKAQMFDLFGRENVEIVDD